MSDVSKTNDLIAEARQWAPCAMSPGWQLKLISRLADALEAATRVPVQGEPNDDREAVSVYEVTAATVAFARSLLGEAADHEDHNYYRKHIGVALEATARAVVPDAECREALWNQQLDLARIAAERDAATAAIERLRSIHKRVAFDDAPGDFHCKRCQITAGTWPCPTVTALDGAPEPEWQYSRGILHKGGLLEIGFGLPRDQVVDVRRRPAGPWLPVEGESDANH